MCEHGKQRRYCKEGCGGQAYCEHGKHKTICKDCGGGGICEHGKRKVICKDCSGTGICEHGKQKARCKECGGSQLCKASHCETNVHSNKYQGYCVICCMHFCPDIPISRNYKTKEASVDHHINENIRDVDWRDDIRIPDGCSKRRPDKMVDLGDQVIIVETDENQHDTYDCSCENKRLMELSQDVGHRPIVFIRFNPDEYTDRSNTNIPSCWKAGKDGILRVHNEDEWAKRLNVLTETIRYWITNRTEKTVEIIHLFYDGFEAS